MYIFCRYPPLKNFSLIFVLVFVLYLFVFFLPFFAKAGKPREAIKPNLEPGKRR